MRDRSRSPLGRDDRRKGGSFGQGGRFDPHSDKMVYFTNLAYDMSWMDLKDVIRDKGGEVQFVELLKNKDGKSKGVAVVEFTSKESAQKTIEVLHRENIRGRVISAKEIRDPQAFFRKIKEESGIDFLKDNNKRDRVPVSRDRRSSPPLRTPAETFGLSSSFLDSLNLKPPLVNRVFITNISYSCGVGKLYDVFAMAGKIVWFDLQLDKEGKSKGMAIVEYSHPIEAVQAISMLNNQRLFDRTITVKMDRFEKDPDRDRNGLPNGLKSVGMGLGANGSPLSDIASVIGQMGSNGQTHIGPFSSNGSGILNQPQSNFPFSQPSVFDSGPVYQSQLLNSGINQSFSSSAQRQISPSNALFGTQASFVKEQVPSPFPSQTGFSGGFDRRSAQLAQNSFQSNTTVRSGQGYLPSYDAPTRVILIKNLPHDYTWDVIAQRVRQFGDFESVELVSSGVAKVRFLHVQDAERAKATLNQTLVENNMIAVEYMLQ
ncbi:unnamed protein product [Bursaphelenchus xylophilus]|uniref:(pine wood nematode) hypothetical protein n=1 Tax=Bursaphelenchus xylophilus TaxID=6326 RepID=A0A1I7RY81_BURXY|nr:unnamed protein product [Bursaphelenchus xylophilus]CAG9085420.1 unnamed protein product [Bursaphelenchus xylophilus]